MQLQIVHQCLEINFSSDKEACFKIKTLTINFRLHFKMLFVNKNLFSMSFICFQAKGFAIP
jgi:hypothetical protein